MDRILRKAIVFFLFSGSRLAFGQSTDGNLTVTATVLTSVSLVIAPDGTQRVVIANASDPADNISRLLFGTPDELHANDGSPSQSSKPAQRAKVGNHRPRTKADNVEWPTSYQHSAQHHED